MAARLRPATPLSVFFFIAFVLLLLSTLSAPIIGAIPLATFNGINFGVFGYCEGSSCSSISVGYSPDSAFSTANNSDFNLPSSTRATLSVILIIHPIATLFSLIGFGLAVASHFHGPAHSTRFLLGQLLFVIPTLLIAIAALIIDFLLFSPHQQYGTYLVLGAAVVLLLATIVCTIMRRTLVSRKQRKQRIAENAEMSGANYAAQRAAENSKLGLDVPPSVGMSNGTATNSNADGLPQFATYDKKEQEEDRTPLNTRTGTMKSSGSSGTQAGLQTSEDGSSRYDDKPPLPPMIASGPGRRPSPRDQYGNPMPPPGPYGMPPPRNQNNSPHGPGGPRGPPQPMYGGRGRGGFPPQRGGYPPRGGYRGPPPQGRGGPPPGWNGPGGPGGPPPMGRPGMGPPPMMMGAGRGRAGPPSPVYNDRYYDGPQDDRGYPPPGPYDRQVSPPQMPATQLPPPHMPPPQMPPHHNMSPPPQNGYDSEPPIGMAVEMDGTQGRPSQMGSNYGLRDSDGDVQGMIGLQQQRSTPEPGNRSPTSTYSQSQGYVPARAAWNQSREQSPLSRVQQSSAPISPPLRTLSPGAGPGPTTISSPRRSSDHYYEDVDARFAADPSPPNSLMPGALRPNDYSAGPARLNTSGPPPPLRTGGPISPESFELSPGPGPMSSYSTFLDPVRDAQGGESAGAKSPAESEASHFTSVSQRGVNPEWRPPPGQPMPPPFYGGGGPPPRQNDMILSNNPDFAVPGMAGRGGRGGRGGGMRGGGAPQGGGRGGMGGYGPGGIPGGF